MQEYVMKFGMKRIPTNVIGLKREPEAGEYAYTYAFEEAGTFSIQIHVEDDKELHEHEVYTVVVE